MGRLKIFITGLSGLLGKALCYEGRDKFNIYGTYFKKDIRCANVSSYKVDIRDKKSLDDLILSIKPDIAIHTAAITDVDFCEQDKESAYEINVNGSRNVLDAIKKLSGKFIYISSDYVFDGNKGYYKEEDIPNPLNYYGLTKLKGEILSLEYDKSLIIRTSIYGFNPKGTKEGIEGIIKNVREGLIIQAPFDMYNSIISVNMLSKIIYRLISENVKGICHIGTKGRISRYEFMEKLFSIFDLPKRNLVPIEFKNYQIKKIARRPQDVSLNTNKLTNDFKIITTTIEDDLNALYKISSSYFAYFGGEQYVSKDL